VIFDVVPDVMMSGGSFLEYDFAGNPCQPDAWKDMKAILHTMSLSLVHFDAGGAAIFSWLDKSSDVPIKFVKSLDALTDDQMPHALLRYVFEYSENVYFSRTGGRGCNNRNASRF